MNKRAFYPPRIFKTRIPELLKANGLKETWLPAFLGVTPSTANRVKNGVDLKLSHALAIANHFKVPVESIWERTEPEFYDHGEDSAA